MFLLQWIGKRYPGSVNIIMFRLIVGFSALFVAGCAAFFSVQGLAALYSSQFIAVCIMAGGLEFGKLVASSYLHRFWDQTGIFLRIYLLLAIFILMSITSLGIFGFLTAAYQQNHFKTEMIDSKKELVELNKKTIQDEIDTYKDRIQKLNDIRTIQEKRVEEAGNYKLPREQAYQAIKEANEEIYSSQEKVKTLSQEVNKLDQEVLILKTEESKSTDIGTLKFVASSFNLEVPDVVKWFTIFIVFVFDPLAVSLVLAYNNIVSNKKKSSPKKEKDFQETSTDIISHELKPFKYRN